MQMAIRQKLISSRSLDGKGYFMDAGVEDDVRKFLATGDLDILNRIPDYRKFK